jgi:hypothetical protein
MIFDKLEDAFVLDGINARTSYTDGIEDVTESEIQTLIDADGSAHIIQVGRDISDILSDYSYDSGGAIIHSRIFMHTFTNEPKSCEEKALLWLIKIFVTPWGTLGSFRGEFEYQGLIKIWRFEPINGVNRQPERAGDSLWRITQGIEFAAKEL